MTTDTYDAFDDFRIGQVVARTFSVLFRNIVPFFLLALIFTLLIYGMVLGLAFLGFDAAMENPEAIQFSAGFFVAIGAMMIGYFVLYYLLTSTIVYGTVQDLRGERASVASCIGRGLAQIGPVVAVALILSVMVWTGFLFLIVPGIILICVYGMAIPVAVVERPGIMASLTRSAELTRGNRWRIFGVILVIFAIQALAGILIGLPLAFLTEEGLGTTLLGILDFVLQAFAAALNAVVIAVIYHDLRVSQEGADSEAIAAVFD